VLDTANSPVRPIAATGLTWCPHIAECTPAASIACVTALAARTGIPHRPARISKPFAGRHSLLRHRPVTSPNTPSVVSGVGVAVTHPFRHAECAYGRDMTRKMANPTHSVSVSEVGVVVSEGVCEFRTSFTPVSGHRSHLSGDIVHTSGEGVSDGDGRAGRGGGGVRGPFQERGRSRLRHLPALDHHPCPALPRRG
jgi:hypothetical protein